MRLLIIADDFTGALDTGVQFARAGAGTLVLPRFDADIASLQANADVLVADTQSRHLGPAEAARRVRALANAAALFGVPHIYKKTDSTLRGNIGAEIHAVLSAAGGPVMFAPAYPAAGRTTWGGRQYVDGIPLERTAFARDPLNPVTTGDIRELIRRQADMPMIAVGAELKADFDRFDAVYLFDGRTDEDLDRIARFLADTGGLRITAGCAGFAGRLADLLGYRKEAAKIPRLESRLLLVCGSVNEQSLRQLSAAETLGFQTMIPGDAPLTNAALWDGPEGRRFVRRAAEALDGCGRLAVRSAVSAEQRLSVRRSADIAHSLGRLTGKILERAKPCALAVFGGDTARGVIGETGCSGLHPIAEIQPGVALSRMTTRLGPLHLISKAGGLGSEDVLYKIGEWIGRD